MRVFSRSPVCGMGIHLGTILSLCTLPYSHPYPMDLLYLPSPVVVSSVERVSSGASRTERERNVHTPGAQLTAHPNTFLLLTVHMQLRAEERTGHIDILYSMPQRYTL